MSWGYRFSLPEEARAEGIEKVRGFDTRVSTAGKLIPYLERHNGKPVWGTSRYGVNMYNGTSGKLFWNAKRESLKTNESWSKLIRMRVAIPVNAFVESSPTRNWLCGSRAWIPGLIDPDPRSGGIVTITEKSGENGGRPILLTQDAAMEWLDAPAWNSYSALDGERVSFEEADIFVAARLDAESKSKVPIAA